MGNLLISLVVLAFTAWSSFSIAAECGKVEPEITVVYWGAKDCQWCTYWESGLSGMKSSFEQSPEFKKINFFEVKRARIDSPPSMADYPQELTWLRDRIEAHQKPFNLSVPAWSIYINKSKVARFYGTRTWNDKIFPKIKKIVADACPS